MNSRNNRSWSTSGHNTASVIRTLMGLLLVEPLPAYILVSMFWFHPQFFPVLCGFLSFPRLWEEEEEKKRDWRHSRREAALHCSAKVDHLLPLLLLRLLHNRSKHLWSRISEWEKEGKGERDKEKKRTKEREKGRKRENEKKREREKEKERKRKNGVKREREKERKREKEKERNRIRKWDKHLSEAFRRLFYRRAVRWKRVSERTSKWTSKRTR